MRLFAFLFDFGDFVYWAVCDGGLRPPFTSLPIECAIATADETTCRRGPEPVIIVVLCSVMLRWRIRLLQCTTVK